MHSNVLEAFKKLNLQPTKYLDKEKMTFQQYFRALSDDEKQQWVDNMINKCYASYKKQKYQILKEDIIFLVWTGYDEGVKLPKDKVEDLAKKALLEVQSKGAKEVMQECGIDTSDYDILVYKQPEKSSVFKLICCCPPL